MCFHLEYFATYLLRVRLSGANICLQNLVCCRYAMIPRAELPYAAKLSAQATLDCGIIYANCRLEYKYPSIADALQQIAYIICPNSRNCNVNMRYLHKVAASASSCSKFCRVSADIMVTVPAQLIFLQGASTPVIAFAAMGAQLPFSMTATVRFW